MTSPESSPVVSRLERIPRKGEYLVVLSDGTELKVLEEHLKTSGIGEGAELSRKRIRELGSAYGYARARESAMRLLRIRPRTELELRRRFKRLRTDRRITERVIADLKDEGRVDDRIFAKLWIEEKVGKGDCGRIRISRDLEAKGVDRRVIAEELKAALSDADELELAGRLAIKKMGRLAGVAAGAGRQKVYAYLLRRGFTSETAAEAAERAEELSGRTDDDENR
jgi:regulatory protein